MRTVFFLFACVVLASTSASLSREYDFSVSLDDASTVWLHWTVDHVTGIINIGIEAKTTGWIGFGLSPTGQMPDSDMVTGWVKDGKGFLQDRHSLGRSLPPIDPMQNVELVAATEDDRMTVLEFTRKIRACEPNDADVPPGTSNVIWAYHHEDPDTIYGLMQHQKMGKKSVNLLDGRIVKPFPSGTPTFDVKTNNFTVPSDATTYWCKPVKLPVVPEGGYLLGYKPIIGHKAIVHHMLVYRCDDAKNSLDQEGECETRDINIKRCWGRSAVAAWGVGGKEIQFPDDVGIPFSGKDGVQYVMIGLHYNNVDMRSDYVDSSGFQFYYTTKKPKHLASFLEFGQIVSSLTFFVPPGLPKATLKSYCSSQCTNAGIPSGGSTVFSVFFHSHTAGVAIRLRQFRNGQDLGYIAHNEHYDFNYQDLLTTQKNVTILPGDSFQTECVYDTSKRTTLTVAGLSTTDEMCLAYLIIYPAATVQTCVSEITSAALADLTEKADSQGWGSFYGSNSDELWQALPTLNFSKPGADAAYLEYFASKDRNIRCQGVEHSDIIPEKTVTMPDVPAEPTPVRPQCTDTLNQPPTIAPISASTPTPNSAAAAARVEYGFLLLLFLLVA